MSAAAEKFEEIVKVYPTAGQFWKPYLERVISSDQVSTVGSLFERCLRQCCNKELWKLYLRFVKMGAVAGKNARQEIMTAYEFVEEHYGSDIGSAWFWHEYVSFVKKSDTDNPWEKTKELTQARKIYQVGAVQCSAVQCSGPLYSPLLPGAAASAL